MSSQDLGLASLGPVGRPADWNEPCRLKAEFSSGKPQCGHPHTVEGNSLKVSWR